MYYGQRHIYNDYCVYYSWPCEHGVKPKYSFRLYEHSVLIPDHNEKFVGDPDFTIALAMAFEEHQRVFSLGHDEIRHRHGITPYEFEKLHGLHDKSGNLIDSDIGYVTIAVWDNWYIREGHGKAPIYKSYIEYEWHCREVEKARKEALAQLEATIQKQVERGVSSGVERAVVQYTRTLEETQAAKADVERQMKELQRQLDRLNEAEQRHIDRQKLLQEQAQLRAAEKAEQERQKAERATTRNRAGYVYLLKQINGEYYKIGRTSNPDDRLATFAVKLPFPVEYEHLIQTDDMYALESELHQRYAGKRVRGEWFALTAQDVLDIITQA